MHPQPIPLLALTATFVLAAATPATGNAQVTAQTPGWFPFVMSPLDVADTPIDLSFLNQPGTAGRVTVRDGHFVDAAGKRLRFLGTNLTFSSCFPDKAEAPLLAKRLAQLGFNLVRFHHMDARDIWLPGQTGLDPEKLDRLDFLLFQLKQNGIYANLNLHVSRTYPGLAELKLDQTYRYGKTLDKFYEPYIRMQEQYATDLLQRVNAYTGLSLTEDPVVAFVELNNENTLLTLDSASPADLPEPLRQDLLAKWRVWLQARYPSLDRLLAEWNEGVLPLGEQLLRNPDFTSGLEGWTVEGSRPGVCEAGTMAPGDGRPALQIRIATRGQVAWAYQLHQIGVSVRDGQTYTIAFRGRSDPPRSVAVGLRFAQAPWTHVSESRTVRFGTDWQEYALVASVTGTQAGVPLRLSLNLGDAAGSVWVGDVSLRPGQAPFDPEPARDLAAMPLPAARWPARAMAPFREFLIDTEAAYGRRLCQHLRDQLRLKALLVDTQASYGGYWGLVREAAYDYIDMHAYWQHPRFPGKPWDSNNWSIPNTSMLAAADGGALTKLAEFRLADKPFSVSEYNHPAPNDYAAELFPLLASVAAVQDWDAIYQFCYASQTAQFRADKITGYFDLSHHSAQLVFAPVAALLFRQAAVRPAASVRTVCVPLPWLRRELVRGWPGPTQAAAAGAAAAGRSLGDRFMVRLDTEGDSVRVALPPGGMPGPDGLLSGPEVAWSPGEAPALTVRSPTIRLAAGLIAGRALELQDLTVTVQPLDGSWAAVALATLDGRSVAESRRLLLVLAARAENTNLGWDEKRTTVGPRWGSGPVLALGLRADLSLPGNDPVRAWALDPRGARGREVPASRNQDAWNFHFDETYQTLWYVLER